MQRPLCSIIIPTYNHGNYIERSIQCALDQTYPNVEVIVVDDGSTDDTKQRLHGFSGSIRYQWQTNAGHGAARNTGIRLSEGQYLQFLDADDTIEKEKIAVQVEILENSEECALVYSDCRTIDRELNEPSNVSYALRDDEDPLSILCYRVLSNLGACLVRKSAVNEIGMFDESRYAQEDWDFWLQLVLKGNKVKYSPGDLAHYDQTGSATTTNPEVMYKRTKHILEKYENDPYFNKLGRQRVNKFIANQSLQLAVRAYNNRWWSAARSHFLAVASADASLMSPRYWSYVPESYLRQIFDWVRGRRPARSPEI